MLALLKRELNGFFNSLIAYVVVAVFLIITGLFLWVFPVEYNVLESGHANIDGLFVLGPFVFLFLVPAITMRLFADEERTGTIEMLVTKPVSLLQIVLAKYLAGVALLVVSLLPTLVYLLTVHWFAVAPGVDMGGAWGSYLGLLLLGMVFVAAGLFASSLTENQLLAFILALFIGGFLYIGFEMLHGLELFGQLDHFVRKLGLLSHYSSMSRGVIDSRDLLYFAGVIVLFLSFTLLSVQRDSVGRPAMLRTLLLVLLVVVVNVAGAARFARIDLTTEGRYTLTSSTRKMLQELDDFVYFRVYLEGNLPMEFRQLRNETREMLDEFRAWSDYVRFEFINPADGAEDDFEQLQRQYRSLVERGLEPAQVQMRSGDGSSQRVIFPGALVSYRGTEIPLPLLKDQRGVSVQEALRQSSVALEYNLSSAVRRLAREEQPVIGLLSGHGELSDGELSSVISSLSRFYEVDRPLLQDGFERIRDHRVLVSARPREAFTEEEKFLLDQYLMYGGSMFWLVDPVFADMDSLRYDRETIGLAWDIRMDDLFFHYGVRLNPVLIKDLHGAPMPVTTGFVAGRPQINLLPWPFFPMLRPASSHMVVHRTDMLRAEFVGTLDTVAAPGVQKQFLLQTSPYNRVMPVPVRISLDILERPLREELFAGKPQPVAVLLEGSFSSLFRNRLKPDGLMPEGFDYRESSLPASMIVMADGSVIRNQHDSEGRPLPLGYDRYSRQYYGNEVFILNAINYLAGDGGVIEARSRDIRIRLLDRSRIGRHQLAVQLINVVLPVLLVMGYGMLRLLYRRRRYAR